ncbi:DUF2141 domain-containing protein [bacterium]|nr:DUF2141 domain-containing protein [bacterium]
MSAMRFITRVSVILSTAALLTEVSACGNSQGRQVGTDPRIPISLSKNNPENSETPANPVGGNADRPLNGTQPEKPSENPATQPSAPQQPPAKPQMAVLTVEFNGLHSTRGNVCMSLFNSPEGFPDSADKAVLAKCFEVIEKSFSVQIRDVPPGVYAIAAWHDENSDGKLNYNVIGIPKEGLAFSENGKPRISPPPGSPSFNSISFEIGDTPRTTQTKMSYLLDLL